MTNERAQYEADQLHISELEAANERLQAKITEYAALLMDYEEKFDVIAENEGKLEVQFNNQMKHKESLKQYWLSCSESKAKWIGAIKEYFDGEHTDSIQNFDEFKEQFDLD